MSRTEHPTPPSDEPDDAHVEYMHQTVKVIRGREANKITELQKLGWELVSQNQGTIRTELAFRKVKPKTFVSHLQRLASQGYAAFRGLAPATQRRVLALVGGVIAGLVVVAIAIGILAGGDNPAPSAGEPQETTAAPETPSETPSPSETPTPTPSVEPTKQTSAPLTSAEVVDAFQAFFDDRAAANVMVAKAISKVSFRDRVLYVTFDPTKVGLTQDQFDDGNPWNNPYDPTESLADFVSAPILSGDDLSIRLRRAVDRFETVNADGEPLGTRTTAEMLALNELD